MKQVHQRRLVAWAATALLLGLCLWPKSWMPARKESPRLVPHLDKVVHLGMFGAFALSWLWSSPPTARPATRRVVVFVASVALAVATEGAQGLPAIDRDPDPLDGLADVAGGVLGIGAFTLLARKNEKETPVDALSQG